MWRYVHSDELYHWKYIKREKGKNGKWRYYYEAEQMQDDIKNALGYDEKARMEVTKSGYEEAKRNKDAAEKAMKDSYKGNYQDGFQAVVDAKNDVINKSKEYSRTVNVYEQRKAVAEEAARNYAKTPLGMIENAAKKGRTFLQQLFGK